MRREWSLIAYLARVSRSTVLSISDLPRTLALSQSSPRYPHVMEWSRVVDVADTVTAISAVVGVVIATWLGLKGIHLAKSGNDQVEQEFLYDQVDGVLQSALTLTAAATDLNYDSDSDPEPERRVLRLADEAFLSRLRVLDALKLLPSESETAAELAVFATALSRTALANEGLRRQGRQLLRPTLFDDSDECTDVLLRTIEMEAYGHSAYEDFGGWVHEASDGRGIAPALSGDASVVGELNRGLEDPDWNPRADESIRLLIPYMKVENALLGLMIDEDGQPVMLREVWAEELTNPMLLTEEEKENQPAWSLGEVDRWFNEWPAGFFPVALRLGIEHPTLYDTPERLAGRLVSDLRTEFLDRVLALIAELREGLNTLPGNTRRTA